MIKEKN